MGTDNFAPEGSKVMNGNFRCGIIIIMHTQLVTCHMSVNAYSY